LRFFDILGGVFYHRLQFIIVITAVIGFRLFILFCHVESPFYMITKMLLMWYVLPYYIRYTNIVAYQPLFSPFFERVCLFISNRSSINSINFRSFRICLRFSLTSSSNDIFLLSAMAINSFIAYYYQLLPFL